MGMLMIPETLPCPHPFILRLMGRKCGNRLGGGYCTAVTIRMFRG